MEDEILYDYTLFPCSHKVMNLTYKPVNIDGHLTCPECKKIRQIESIRIKRF